MNSNSLMGLLSFGRGFLLHSSLYSACSLVKLGLSDCLRLPFAVEETCTSLGLLIGIPVISLLHETDFVPRDTPSELSLALQV